MIWRCDNYLLSETMVCQVKCKNSLKIKANYTEASIMIFKKKKNEKMV